MKPPAHPRDPWQVLGILSDATPDEIKAAYRRAARTWHPDRNPSPEAAAKFREATAAYLHLSKGEKVERLKGSPAYRSGGFTPPAPPHARAATASAAGVPFPGIPRSDAQAAADLDALRDALRAAFNIPAHLDPVEVLADGFAEFYFATKRPPRRRRRSAFEKFLDFLAGD